MSTILSTKKLTPPQQELILNTGIGVVHFNILEIEHCEIKDQLHADAIIITSKNAIPALEKRVVKKSIFCVGRVTAELLKGHEVSFIADNATDLAHYIIKNQPKISFDYLCSSHRRNELPDLLKAQNIPVKEHIAYHSHEVSKSFDRTFARVLFYSPRGVLAFAKANSSPQPFQSKDSGKIEAVCIGNTTAAEANKHFTNVITATKPTVTNTIITAIKSLKNDKE